MLKFLSLSLILLLLTAPEFITEEYYAVDNISDGIIMLEPLASEHSGKYVCEKTFPRLKEGQIVSVKMIGGHPIKVSPDLNITESRIDHIHQLLDRLTPSCLDDL